MQIRARAKKLMAIFLLLGASICVLLTVGPPYLRAAEPKPGAPAISDKGPHDFDFELGRWKIHIRQARSAVTAAVTWDRFDGSTVNCKLWDGAAIQKWQADGPTGHIEGLTLRIYDPQSQQWNLYGADRSGGALAPAVVGEFRDGRGVFIDQEPMNGRLVLVRSVWSDITANSVHFEAHVSDDAGKTWRPVLITDQTRSAGPEDCGGLAREGMVRGLRR